MTRKCWHLIKQKMPWRLLVRNMIKLAFMRVKLIKSDILSISRALANKNMLIFYRNPFKNVCKSPNCNVVCSSNKGKTLMGFSTRWRLKLNENNPRDLHLAWPSLADMPPRYHMSLSLSVCRQSVIRAGVSVSMSPGVSTLTRCQPLVPCWWHAGPRHLTWITYTRD